MENESKIDLFQVSHMLKVISNCEGGTINALWNNLKVLIVPPSTNGTHKIVIWYLFGLGSILLCSTIDNHISKGDKR